LDTTEEEEAEAKEGGRKGGGREEEGLAFALNKPVLLWSVHRNKQCVLLAKLTLANALARFTFPAPPVHCVSFE